MPEWRVASARLTVFVAPDTVVPSTLWRDVVGEDPESSVVQRATATKTESGPFADGILTLQVQPMRVDWLQEPVGPATEGAPPVLGAFPDAAEPLVELGHRWARSTQFPSTQRVALGLILISDVSDRQIGYRELANFIDGVPESTDAVDFLYQVNRPRDSRAGIEGLYINRLSKWSVAEYRVVIFAPAAASVATGALRYHLRLELDINTMAEFEGLIPQQKVDKVIDDLFEGAHEICEQGNRF